MDDQRLEEIARRFGRRIAHHDPDFVEDGIQQALREALSSQEEELRQHFARIPHENIEQCPTYYDGCNCTTENVRGLMEQAGKLAKRAEAAEAELLRLRSKIAEITGDL